MYDKNDIRLKAGDIVITTQRQINNKVKSELAIINDIEPLSALIILLNNNMPMPFLAKPSALTKVKESDIDENSRLKLEVVNVLFNEMSEEISRV